MNIETVGHAGLLIRDDAGTPVLFTDPWITGSCYWRSWWLQNYPTPELLAELKSVAYCFITHEHPDHFHTASIRQLGQDMRLSEPRLAPGPHRAVPVRRRDIMPSWSQRFEWMAVHPDVRILSIPLFNDDSVLVIDTPDAVIVNQNDSKPRTRAAAPAARGPRRDRAGEAADSAQQLFAGQHREQLRARRAARQHEGEGAATCATSPSNCRLLASTTSCRSRAR